MVLFAYFYLCLKERRRMKKLVQAMNYRGMHQQSRGPSPFISSNIFTRTPETDSNHSNYSRSDLENSEVVRLRNE